jgi:hypothetical protein
MNIVVKDRRDLFAVGPDGDEQLRPGLASRFRCVACDHIDAVRPSARDSRRSHRVPVLRRWPRQPRVHGDGSRRVGGLAAWLSQAPDPTQGPSPVPSKGGAFWKQQIDLALAARKEQEPVWEANDKAYAPRTGAEYTGYAAQINTNRDFTLVERKKADLFYQRPDVTLQPSPLLDGPIAGPTASRS